MRFGYPTYPKFFQSDSPIVFQRAFDNNLMLELSVALQTYNIRELLFEVKACWDTRESYSYLLGFVCSLNG